MAPPHSAPPAAAYSAPLAPAPRLSPSQLTLLLVAACLVPLAGLTLYATFFGRASDAELPVEVTVGKEPVESMGGQGAILADVVAINNLADHELSNLTVDLNGQYFLHRHSPLGAGERVVFPQQIFATKSNQRWVPGRYGLTHINVTAKLPSGRRGVQIVRFD